MTRQFFIFAALTALLAWGSVGLIPYTAFYPKIIVQDGQNNALEFFLKGQTERSACEAVMLTMKSSILQKCPSCRLQAGCTRGPDADHRLALGNLPLQDVSFRYVAGVVVIRAKNPSQEAAICNVMRSSLGGDCTPPGKRRHS